MMINVLVVDDEIDAGDLYRQQFRKDVKAGSMKLHIALGGEEALEILGNIADDRPLIILSDVNMPGMNGFELLKLIKSRWPELKVVMVSAYAGNSDYVMEAKEQGAADFLTKPMDFDIIREKIVSETSTY